MLFYDKLSILCRRQRTSPSAVAVAIGLTASSASYWKHGATPKMETLKKVALHFSVPIDYFFIEEETNHIVDISQVDLSEEDNFLLSMCEAVLHNAYALKDEALLTAMQGVPDSTLEKLMLNSFRAITRKGRLQALELLQQILCAEISTRG